MNNPILITGAAGFIGSNLARYFVDRKSEVNIIIKKNTNIWRIKDIISKLNVFYGDLTNKKRITNIIKQIKPKTIFHLATHGAYPDQNCAEKIKKIALDSTIHLVNQCKKYSFSVFINTGSSSEYGFKRKSMRENDVLEPNSYYSVFKCAVDFVINHFINNFFKGFGWYVF